jgi:DNA-binding MarR family transcriptional regulator
MHAELGEMLRSKELSMRIQVQTRRAARGKRPGLPERVLDSPGFDGRLDETMTFMRLLWALDHGMRTVSKSMRVRLGVTGPERLIVRMVGLHTRLSQRELADLLHLHTSSLTTALERLERRGLLTRRTDPSDRRRTILQLTARGRCINRLRADTVESRIRRALAALRDADIEVAAKVLATLAAVFGSSYAEGDGHGERS